MAQRRIKESDLETRVNRINILTGIGETPQCCQAGSYQLDIANGGYALVRISRNGGCGCNDVITRCTKRELYDRLWTFEMGIQEGLELAKLQSK